jgi:hypothetical protein
MTPAERAVAEAEAVGKIKASKEPAEIVGLMEEHAGAVGVQEQGCNLLGNLSYNNANRVKIAELGGIEAVRAGMLAHPDAAGVQEAGCSALYNLCENNTANQVKVAELGGIEVVLAGMLAHPDAAVVQNQGCRALCYICYDNNANVKRMKALGTVREVVERAVAAHPSNSSIQTFGKELLAKLA